MADKGGDRIMELKNRSQYLDKLISVQDMEVIKVVTGIRRCGKSSLLKLMMAHLREQGVMEEQILSMNFESMQFADMDSKRLYQYVTERAPKGKRLYLFLDEVQKVRDWQDAVNSFRVDLDCDIYVTGSNAYLLSSELSTYLSGRYVEIKMLPLSFREFLDFHGYLLDEYKAPNGTMKQRAKGKDGEAYELRDLFEAYAQFGGMPALAEAELDQERANMLLDGIYSAVVVRDILERGKRKEQRAVTDALLLPARSFCFWLTTSATTPRRRPSGAPLSARACWTMAERPSLRCRPSLPISTHCWSPISFMRSSVLTSRGRAICGRWANTISSIPASAPIC